MTVHSTTTSTSGGRGNWDENNRQHLQTSNESSVDEYAVEDDDDEDDNNDDTEDDSFSADDDDTPAETVINSEEDRIEAEERRRQKRVIKELLAEEPKLKEGDTWYVLAAYWSKKWKEYVNFDREDDFLDLSRPKPPPIDNTILLEPGTDVTKRNIFEEQDFIIVYSAIWDTFIEWYGGGPPIPRKVISQGYVRSLLVEVRPLSLSIVKSSDLNTEVRATFSKADTVGKLKKDMCEAMNLNPEDVRVWDYHGKSKLKLLTNANAKLDEAQILDGQMILLEEKNADGTWPESYGRSYSSSSSHNSYSYGSSYSSTPSLGPGLTGLANLGNTCFMNSALQSLSHTQPLTEFFLTDAYQQDVNETNPLGSHGELAEQYALLIKDLWSGHHNAVAPRDFKWKLERFAPQFVGYQQHDSQELLAFLLDGLHEDLNRVKQKPYRENKEDEGRSDKELADEAWDNHKARNDSIIVDWFQGQLKSTLVCPVEECHKVSVTFDPFMYLSLPLPQVTTRSISVTMYWQDGSKPPTKYSVSAPKAGRVPDLKKALGELCDVPGPSIVLADVYNCNFFKHLSDEDKVESIQDRDVINGYQITIPNEDEEKVIYLPVVHRHEILSYGSYRKALFGTPFVVTVPLGATYKQLHAIVLRHIKRLIKPEFLEVANSVPKKVTKVTSVTDESERSLDGSTDTKALRTSDKKRLEESGETSTDNTLESSTDNSFDSDSEKTEDEAIDAIGSELFTLSIVESHGTSDAELLVDNDQPLPVRDRQTIAITWTRHGYEEAYDKNAELHVEAHPSTSESQETDSSVSLYKCLDLFTSVEKLGPDDPWYCNKCKEFRQATKKFDLWRLPRILVIHLKRFSYKNRYWREKLETLVDFPMEGLDLSHLIKAPDENAAPAIYDLYAVSNHYGSMGGGHYTAFGKSSKDGNWYKFDDSYVSKVEDKNSVKTSAAYVLFYRRRDSLNDPIVEPAVASTSPMEVSSTTSSSPTPVDEEPRTPQDAPSTTSTEAEETTQEIPVEASTTTTTQTTSAEETTPSSEAVTEKEERHQSSSETTDVEMANL